MQPINSLTIDSTRATTELCRFGAEFGTDKSPYSKDAFHRHPYSAVYDLLLAGMRTDEIIFGEVGILDNASMRMWRAYLPKAKLIGFDFFQERIDRARGEQLENTTYIKADVSNRLALAGAFRSVGSMFDVLIDDSTHLFEHQILFTDVALDFVKPGGLIIIEDIFRDWDEARYANALAPFLEYIDWASFIDTTHALKFSDGSVEPYFNNDKMLVLRRNCLSRQNKLDVVPVNDGLKIFMATHKPYVAPDDPHYHAVQAGAQQNVDFGLLRDDSGINISLKNPYYSEMSVHYWIWKNVTAEYVGLVHYRRFFEARKDSCLYRGIAVASGEDILNEIADFDLIAVSPTTLMQPQNSGQFSVEGQYVYSHGFELLLARKAIETLAADYLPAFDMVMRNSKLIPYNLIVARKAVFDRYSAWLFAILFYVEANVQLQTLGEYQGRVLAFLAERLMTVWIVHNQGKIKTSFRNHVFLAGV